jgi:DNA repair protein RadC
MPQTYNASLRLRDMAVDERPQERLEKNGTKALSDTELLAMLLRSGSKTQDVLAIASRVIAEAESLAGLLTWTEEDFKKLKGIGHIKALQLLTVMEIAKRILMQKEKNATNNLSSPETVYEYFKPIVAGLEVEKFWVLCLNRKNRLIKHVEISSGTANASLVHPREVYREAVRFSASAIICVHNHPSGDCTPSQADIQVTRQLKETSKVLDIPFVDHIIIGLPFHDPFNQGFYSFVQSGLLEMPAMQKPKNKSTH